MLKQDIPKPNFIIIGSAKCGTTTLADILASHPDCCFSRPKEVAFFSHDENYSQGWEWYKKSFLHYQGEKVIGEATPNYSNIPSSPNCAERIYKFNPNTLIVFIVRHPYKKLISLWKMAHYLPKFVAHEYAQQGFEPFIRHLQENLNVLDNCRFDFQLQAYRELFGESKIKVLFLEDWAENPKEEAFNLCSFLGLEPSKLPKFDHGGSNRSDRRFKERTYFGYLRKLSLIKPILKLIPSPISLKLGRLIGFEAISAPELKISAGYKQEIIHYFKDDAISFLEKYGKSKSFWNFNTIP